MERTKITAVAVCLLVSVAVGAPQHYVDTDHYYEAVAILHEPASGYTWHEVRAFAEGTSFLGARGHLATITSEGENAFVADLCNQLGHDTFYWLGGFQPEGSPEPDGDWQWITGEDWTYTNWKPSNPSDSGTYGIEDHLGIVGSDAKGLLGLWNDMYAGLNPDRPWSSYVVEYPVPEPTVLSLLAVGLAALLRRRAAWCRP
jgi:hypothetical protein